MMMPLGCYLWQVSHTDNLGVGTEFPKQVTNNLCACAPNTHIYFIKDQGRRAGGLGGNHLDGKADA